MTCLLAAVAAALVGWAASYFIKPDEKNEAGLFRDGDEF